MDLSLIQSLKKTADSKIVMLVLDGLGGIPDSLLKKTALESAFTPHLDALVGRGICGLHQPVGSGITPGSGPGHLALFGYDPIRYQVGRGVLSALGIDFKLNKNDIAARGNFCTVDEKGVVTDRRAGRISSSENEKLIEKLRGIKISGIEIFLETIKEHRFLLVLRGDGFSGKILDTDPEETGRRPLHPEPIFKNAGEDVYNTIQAVSRFISEAGDILKNEHPANMILLRGFSTLPDWPRIEDIYGMRCAAIAEYPMYRGLARLLGMEVLDTESGIEGELKTLSNNRDSHDFFYVHVKQTDSAGEDGDFQRKVEVIEEVDRNIPSILGLEPDVLIVTGDHSTPAAMKSHSWHPVPVLLWSRNCRSDGVSRFNERACTTGELGPRIPGKDLLPIAAAHAGRLKKFGA